jgi:hypothetical protein
MTVNEALLRAAGNMILAYPENWDQHDWCSAVAANSEGVKPEKNFCGTSFCLAGWGAYLTHYVRADGSLTKQGRKWLRDRTGASDEALTNYLNTFGSMENTDWTALGEEIFGLPASSFENELFMAGTRTDLTAEEFMRMIEDRTGVVVAPVNSRAVPGSVNVPLLRAVVAMIEAFPENWRQSAWCTRPEDQDNPPETLCGTQFCVAGWAVTLAGISSYRGNLTKHGKAFMKERVKTTGAMPHFAGPYSGWAGEQLNYAEAALREDRVVHWESIARELLGIPDYIDVFGGSYATTVDELKSRLTHDLGIEF